MIRKGSFSSNFLVLFSGNTIAQIIPFLFQPLITRLFSAEEIAISKNFLALAAMIAIAAAGRYELAIVLPANKKQAMNLVSLSVRLIFVVSVCSVLFYFFKDQINSLYGEGDMGQYLLLIVLAIPLYAFTNVLTHWLIREKKYSSITSSVIARSVFLNLFIVLFGYAAMDALGLILGTLLGLLVALVMMYISAKNSLDISLIDRNGRSEVSKTYKDFPLVNAPHAFADLLFSQVILYAIITRDFSLKELGYYTMMSSLLLASMRAIGGAVGQLYYKEASELKAAGDSVSLAFFRSIKMVAVFAIPASVGVFFFGPPLFGWYLSEEYRVAGEYAQIMIVPFFLNFLASPVSGTPIIYRKQMLAFIFSLVGYGISIAALLIGNSLGYNFKESLVLFAIAQSLYYLLLLIWYVYLTRNKVKK